MTTRRPKLTKDQKHRLQPWLEKRGQLLRRFREAARRGATRISCPLCEQYLGAKCEGCPLYRMTKDGRGLTCGDYMPGDVKGLLLGRDYIRPWGDCPENVAAVKSWAAKCAAWFEAQREASDE